MSITRSISTNSTSSSNITPTVQPNGQRIDPSNILYNDHQNYQTIFTNDSRFFDTSLHLFKSYCDLGYIKLHNKKSKKIYLLLHQMDLFNVREQNQQDLVLIKILMKTLMEQ